MPVSQSYSEARAQVLTCCEWSPASRKNWAIIGVLFIILYTCDVLFFWGLLEAAIDDVESTSIAYVVILFTSILIIIGMVIYGHFSGALEKIQGSDKNENVVAPSSESGKLELTPIGKSGGKAVVPVDNAETNRGGPPAETAKPAPPAAPAKAPTPPPAKAPTPPPAEPAKAPTPPPEPKEEEPAQDVTAEPAAPAEADQEEQKPPTPKEEE